MTTKNYRLMKKFPYSYYRSVQFAILTTELFILFLVTWCLVVFGDEVTKILHNSLFTFFTGQGKTGQTEI